MPIIDVVNVWPIFMLLHICKLYYTNNSMGTIKTIRELNFISSELSMHLDVRSMYQKKKTYSFEVTLHACIVTSFKEVGNVLL